MSTAPAGAPHRLETPGGAYRVRAARPEDAAALRRMLEAAPAEDIRLRFFRQVRAFPDALVEPLTRADGSRHFAFVAEPADDPASIVASALLVADPDGRGAEFGIFVAPEHRRHGLGTHLLDCLRSEAGAHGIGRIHSLILGDNQRMVDLARYYGFTLAPDPDEPQCLRAEYAVERTAS